MIKVSLLTWILWKTSFTWSVIMLTEGELLLYILLSLSAVLLLWSVQLTRNFNFTNGHWFPIADIVYCPLLVSRWIIPRLDVSLTSCLRLTWDNVWPVPGGHEVTGHQLRPTSRVTICIGWLWAESITNDATEIMFLRIRMVMTLSFVTIRQTVSLSALDDYQRPCSIVGWIKHVWCEWGVFWVEIQLCWWEISVCISE